MVAEDADRLPVLCTRDTQCLDQSLQGGTGADEAPTAAPVDQIDMRVDLTQAAHGLRALAGPESRQAAEADFRQGRHERRRDAVPGWNQYGQRLATKQPLQRHPAGAEIAD